MARKDLHIKGSFWLVLETGKFPVHIYQGWGYLNFSFGFGRIVFDFADVG